MAESLMVTEIRREQLRIATARYRKTDKGKVRDRRYKASAKGRVVKHRARQTYRLKYPEKRAAHNAVAYAVAKGYLERPDICEHCGVVGVLIEASHSDYSQRLNVEWLCQPCHRTKDALGIEGGDDE